MSNFWNIEDNTQAAAGSYTVLEDIIPIPSKTQCLAFIEEAKWDTYDTDEYISLRWKVLQPDEYKNRVIFQKIKVNDMDTKKRDKAKRMLLAIDHNAKGGLAASGEAPTDTLLQAKLCNRPMMIMVMQWSMTDEITGITREGNWISAVAPKGDNVPEKVVNVVVEDAPPVHDETEEAPF